MIPMFSAGISILIHAVCFRFCPHCFGLLITKTFFTSVFRSSYLFGFYFNFLAAKAPPPRQGFFAKFCACFSKRADDADGNTTRAVQPTPNVHVDVSHGFFFFSASDLKSPYFKFFFFSAHRLLLENPFYHHFYHR